MKRRALSVIIVLIALLYAVMLLSEISAQEEGKNGDIKEGVSPKGRFKEAMLKRHTRLDRIGDGQQWLEDVKKYRDEINALENELEPVRKEVRDLLEKLQKAENESEKQDLRNKIENAAKKENELDLKISEKKKEFAGKNFRLALERMIEAEVEYRETERAIWLRDQFIKRLLKGERLRWRHDRKGEDVSPEGTPK